MAVYTVTQKLFSFNHQFTIDDGQGTPVLTVQGKVISIGRQLTFFDMSGAVVAEIRQKLPSLLPAYDVVIGGQTVLTVRRVFGMRPKFALEGPGWTVQGDWLGRDFDIVDSGGMAQGHISRNWGPRGVYAVETPAGAPDIQVLCAVVAMELARETQH